MLRHGFRRLGAYFVVGIALLGIDDQKMEELASGRRLGRGGVASKRGLIPLFSTPIKSEGFAGFCYMSDTEVRFGPVSESRS